MSYQRHIDGISWKKGPSQGNRPDGMMVCNVTPRKAGYFSITQLRLLLIAGNNAMDHLNTVSHVRAMLVHTLLIIAGSLTGYGVILYRSMISSKGLRGICTTEITIDD